jgi:hypothetical protein
MLRFVVLFSLLSGAILSLALSNMHTAELPLFSQLMDQLVRGDILLADRGFGNFILLALLQKLNRGVDFIGRSVRHVDGRRRHQSAAIWRQTTMAVRDNPSKPCDANRGELGGSPGQVRRPVPPCLTELCHRCLILGTAGGVRSNMIEHIKLSCYKSTP